MKKNSFLYLTFLFYVIAGVLSVNTDSNKFYYTASFLAISYGIYLISNKVFIRNDLQKEHKFDNRDYILFILFLLIIPLSTFYQVDFFKVIFFPLVIVYSIYFSIFLVEEEAFINYINLAFLTYLILSVMGMYDIIISSPEDPNSFNYDFGVLKFETLYGLEGSTAHIDSFAGLVFLINMFRNKKKENKYIFLFLSSFALAWTTRFTPIVALIVSLLTFLVIRNKSLALLSIISIFAAFFGVIYILTFYPNRVALFGLTYDSFFYLATHGRAGIWTRQFHNIVNSFSFFDFLFGNFSLAEVKIHWRAGYTSNSHNSFLNIFFRAGFLGLLLFSILVRKSFQSFKRNTFPIIIAIIIAATTNSTIFYVSNPIYLHILFFYLNFKKAQK